MRRCARGIAGVVALAGIVGLLITEAGCARPGRIPPAQPSVASGKTGLSPQQATALAVRLANDECQRLYNRQPFTAQLWPIRLVESRYRWGELDPVGVNGFSAEVSFRTDGTEPEVTIWYSTDVIGPR